MPDIALILAQSRAAHLAYRSAKRYNNASEARVQMARANELRAEAHDADPEHADPAWTDEAPTHDHTQLLAYYAQQLART